MRSLLPLMLAAISLSTPAAAHEIWVERDGDGPARIYLGEPAQPVPEGGDPEFHRLKVPLVFTADPKQPAATTRRADHLEVAAGEGDVRVRDDSVFDPWGPSEKKEGAIFYARAGRSDTQAKLDLELVPVRPGADQFTVMFRGKALPGASVNIITPDRWQKSFEADANGRIDVPSLGKGRYILATSHGEDAAGTVAGKPVTKVQHISTLTFVR